MSSARRACLSALAPSLAAALLAALPFNTAAQTPGEQKRPIRLLVPSAPGGPSDFAARLVSNRLAEAIGQSIIVDNRPSVNGIVASEIVAKAPPDGFTLLIGNIGTMVMNVGLYKKLPYEPQRDFVPIGQLVSAGTALIANPKFTPNNFKEFVAHARKDPDRITIAVAGANGAVATEVLKYMAGIRLVNVPFKGSSPSEIAVLSNEVSTALLSIPVVTPHVRQGRMKIYGVTTAKRSFLLPEVPTIQEQGLAGYEFGNWHGMLAPKGTSPALIRRLNTEANKVLAQKDLVDIALSRGNEIIANSPEDFAAVLARDIPRYKKIMASAGIEAQ
ncbi:MAG: Bug family tripartite tricarboxylate transporter substrate binding protein [Betaproteobacteria bacterium]